MFLWNRIAGLGEDIADRAVSLKEHLPIMLVGCIGPDHQQRAAIGERADFDRVWLL